MSFGQVANWGIKTIDTLAETKKVVWRPVTAATSVIVGQPVCYNSDLAGDVNEKTTNRLSSDFGGGGATTYAEGAQTYNARFLVVEEPLTANLHAWAGIVKDLGPLRGADGDTIEIYVPVEGAVVPVYCAQNCTLDRTVMGIQNGQADVDFPGRPIGVAKETVDRSSTDGLVWMEFKNFPYQVINGAGDATANALIVDDEAAANAVTLNSLNARFDGTGRARMLYAVGEINGAGHSNFGMFKFRTYISAAASQAVHTLCANLHVKDAGTLTDGGEFASAPIYATVETEVTSAAPTLSGGSLAAMYVGYYVDESTAAPAAAYPFWFNSGTYNWDGLIKVQNPGDIGDYASTGNAPALATGDWMIPIKIAGSTYYLVALADAGV